MRIKNYIFSVALFCSIWAESAIANDSLAAINELETSITLAPSTSNILHTEARGKISIDWLPGSALSVAELAAVDDRLPGVDENPTAGIGAVKNNLQAMSKPTLGGGLQQSKSLTQPSVKIPSDGSGNWTIMQGFTWVPETEKIYTAWDGTVLGVNTVVIMRHGANGDFELKSAGVNNLINHGQDLGHAYYNGVLYLFASNPNGPGITVFTPPTVEGGPIGNVRQFKLLSGASWGLMTTGESSDSRFVVTYVWDSSKAVDPQYVHIFDFKKLMDGADGDRFNEYIAKINLSPRDEYWARKRNTIQSVTCDSANVYVLTSADRTTDLKYLSAFDIVSGKRQWRKQLLVGQANAKARGVINEYEGMAWVLSNAGVGKSLWIGIRMRTLAGKGNEMFIMPIHESIYGSSGAD